MVAILSELRSRRGKVHGRLVGPVSLRSSLAPAQAQAYRSQYPHRYSLGFLTESVMWDPGMFQ
jgi:hypothetical protein